MSKKETLLRSLLILGMLLTANAKRADAFGFIPPLPPEAVVDFPDDASKVFSVAQAAFQKVQTEYNRIASFKLDAIKGALPNLGSNFNVDKKSGPKNSGKQAAKTNSELPIKSEEDLLNETAFFQTHNALFFTYPSKAFSADENSGKANVALLKTAYKRKGATYRQDVLIDTYLTARVTEDYLIAVERTINRLDACQKNPEPSNCTFFGMTMQKVESTNNPPEGDKAGQIGAATNAYIVTMVYDRLMRLVEDLTATEALYQSSRQTGLIDPVLPGNSSAEDYLPLKYQFASRQIHEHSYAKVGSLLNEKGLNRLNCSPDEVGCPAQNKDGKSQELSENTEILEALQPIDSLLSEAMTIHNMKNKLPAYKVLYRKYLRSIEIHKRALQAVYDSDQCVVNFLNKHSSLGKEKWKTKWGIAKSTKEEDINNYDGRVGTISYDLIRKYQDHVTNTILETKNECDGYYLKDNCPDGYKTDEENPCETNKDLYPCLLENGVEFDSGTNSQLDSQELSSSLSGGIETLGDKQKGSLSFNETDYVSNNEDIDKISIDNRIRSEWPWRIGSEKIMELTNSREISFEPWNDQKDLQTQYLRQKYNNITNIIKTTDKAINSYKIANTLAGGYSSVQDETLKEEMQTLIKGVLECKTAEQAKSDVKTDYCQDFTGTGDTLTKLDYIYKKDDDGKVYQSDITLTCKVTADSNKGTVTYERQEMSADHWNITTATGTIYQIVSYSGGKCQYKNDVSELAFEEIGGCPGVWNFTKSFLVKNYMPAVIGNCKEDAPNYLYAKGRELGRIVAQDKLTDVLAQRRVSDTIVDGLIRTYENAQQVRRNQLNDIKQQMTSLNKGIDAATKEKNIIKKELDRAKTRISSIGTETEEGTELYQLAQRRKTIETSAQAQKVEVNNEDLCSLDYQKIKLEHEKTCIKGEENKDIWSCPASCQSIKEAKQPDICRGIGKTLCSDYITTVSQMITAKTTKPATDASEKIAKLYLIPTQAEAAMQIRQDKINSAKQRKKALQELANAKQKEIDDAAADFTASEEEGGKYGKSYIVTAEKEVENIEAENEEFEKFLAGDENERMYDRDKEHCVKKIIGICIKHAKPTAVGSDNLENTLVQIFDYDDNISKTIKGNMEATWINTWQNSMNAAINSLGLKFPTKFVIDDSFANLVVPLGAVNSVTPLTVNNVLDKVKDIIVASAADEVKKVILKGDKVISEEMTAAEAKVVALTTQYGIKKDATPTIIQLNEISKQANYMDSPATNNPKISNAHASMVANLKKATLANAALLQNSEIDLGELFGIAKDIEKTPDDNYFVALPARGVNYLGKPDSDTDAGRDYRSPKGPLLNLPPVREVFYFDAQDYKDIPTRGDKPAIAYLLNKKFPSVDDAAVRNWEYMPEIWRYLLARTNIRNDGKYQQTFVERSYKTTELKKLTENENVSGAKSSHYGTIIGRGGVYPCVLNGFNVVDVEGSNNIAGLTFRQDKQKNASGIVKLSCKEIAPNKISILSGNAISRENLCYLYNNKKAGICHLLAEHGKNKDTQTSISSKNIVYYDKYSELGQFLRADNRSLHYRDMQRSIAEYLTSEDESKTANTITRQKAELSSFKRNVMGSFLEAVAAEHAAKKNRDNLRAETQSRLQELCSQVHQNGKSVSSALNDEKYLSCDDECQKELDEKCAKYIIDGKGQKVGNTVVGLAYAAADKKDTRYGANGEYKDKKKRSTYGGLSCNLGLSAKSKENYSYYESIYCDLDSLKDQKVATAKSKFAAIKNKVGKDKEYVKERFADIERMITILEKDADEVVYLTPDTQTSEIVAKINKAKADRAVERDTDEEGITAMDNGTQVVPYCPNY